MPTPSRTLLLSLGLVALLAVPAVSGAPDHPAPPVPGAAAVHVALEASYAERELAAAAHSLARDPSPAPNTCPIPRRAAPCGAAEAPMIPPSSSPLPFPWTPVVPTVRYHEPPARRSAMMTYDAHDGYVLLYGGFNDTLGVPVFDSWTYREGIWSPIYPAQSPPPRMGASMTYDAYDGYVVLFGGGDGSGSQIRNDTWTYSAGHWTDRSPRVLTPTNNPAPRYLASLTFDPAINESVLFGGCSGYYCSDLRSDTWGFRAGNWTNLSPLTSPPPRAEGMTTWDPVDGVLLLFGGANFTQDLSDTWRFQNGQWTRYGFSLGGSPPGTVDGYFAWDVPDGHAVLFGGQDPGLTNDTWTFAGGSWTDRTASIGVAPAPIWTLGNIGTYDAHDGYDLLYTGFTGLGQDYNQTWEYRESLHAALSASRRAVDLNQSVSIWTQAVAGSSPYHYAYTGLPSGCPSVNSDTLNCTFAQLGTFRMTVNVTDSGGNFTLAWLNLTSYPDLTASAAIVPSEIDEGDVTNVTVTTVGGSGNLSFEYWGLPGGCGTFDTEPLGCLPTVTGNFSIGANVTDTSGATVRLRSLNLTVWPTLRISVRPLAIAIDLGESLQIVLNDSGGKAPLALHWDGLPPGCLAPLGPVLNCTPSSSGLFRVYGNVTDAIGGHRSVNLPINVSAAPSVGISADVTFGFAPLSPLFLATRYGGVGPFQYRWDFGDGSAPVENGSSELVHSFVAAGTYQVEVTLNDSHGRSARSSLSVGIVAHLAVTLHVAPARGVLDAGQPLTLSANITGGGRSPHFAWAHLPDGCPAADAPTIACVPTASGDYPVSVTVTDELRESEMASIALSLQPPIRAAIGPVDVHRSCSAPFVVNFTGRAIDGLGPYRYLWSFGDGAFVGGSSSVEYAYRSAGQYPIRLLVTDSTGANASTNASVGVLSEGCQPTFLGIAETPSGWGLLLAGVVGVAAVGALLYWFRRGEPEMPDGEASEASPAGADEYAGEVPERIGPGEPPESS